MFETYSDLLILFSGLVGLGIAIAVFKSFQPPKLDKDPKAINENREIAALKQECLNLRSQLEQQSETLAAEYRHATFQQLQSLLTQYKSVQQMVHAKPDLPARNLLALFTPLDNLLLSWDYEAIGSAWEQVEYNPQLHQPDNSDIKEGESVYIRFIGYQDKNGHILVPAKVSRTLPGGNSNS
jgi:hypothetical protein